MRQVGGNLVKGDVLFEEEGGEVEDVIVLM